MTEPSPPIADDPLKAAGPAQPRSKRRLLESPALPFAFLRTCIYLILSYVLSALCGSILRFISGRPASGFPWALMTGEAVAFAGIFAAAWIMSRVEKRNLGDYGLPLRDAFRKQFWLGALLGTLEISVVVGIMAAFGAYHFGPLAVHGAALIRWLLFWAVFFTVVGLYEEFQFRGYLQFTAAQPLTFWPAAVLLSLVFGWVHTSNPGESWVGIAGVILAGLLWCFTLRRTGSLWLAVGMHAASDFAESFVYSVPDSGLLLPGHLSNAAIAGPTWLTGGSVGPEASIFDFLMLVLFFFVIDRLYPAKTAASPSPEGQN
jgi:uncharacterized protein